MTREELKKYIKELKRLIDAAIYADDVLKTRENNKYRADFEKRLGLVGANENEIDVTPSAKSRFKGGFFFQRLPSGRIGNVLYAKTSYVSSIKRNPTVTG